MPGPVSDSFQGAADNTPYVPSWCYENGPKQCPCGHHEGYHNDAGECLLQHECGCKGLPAECLTPLDNDPARDLAGKVLAIVRGQRLTLTDEKRMQRELSEALDAAGVTYERERRLNRGDVVDFMLAGGVAVECKLRESKMAIFRQLRRYAQHPDVRAIVLVSNTAMGLPPEIEGKPTYYCSLGAAWL